MFYDMIKLMEQQTEEALIKKSSARKLWLNGWAKEVLAALDGKKPVIYTTVYAFPMEILQAFDVVSFDFELACGLFGGMGMLESLLETAADNGMPADTCAFHRAAIGASYQDILPKPDLMITTSFFCDGKAKTNEILSLKYKTDVAFLYVPQEISIDSIRYVKSQLIQIVKKIESVTGQTFDMDRFKTVIESSNRARQEQLKILDLLKLSPAPWGGSDMFAYSISGQMFDGSELKEKINQSFVTEMTTRHEKGTSHPERHRIYWMAWFPTYQCNLNDVLKTNGVSVPVCESFRVNWDAIDPDDPFEGLAIKCLKNIYIGDNDRRMEDIERIVSEYRINGAILFATPACRHSKTAFRVISDRFARINVPFLLLDMEIGDPRQYQSEQTRTRIEGFVEMLNGH